MHEITLTSEEMATLRKALETYVSDLRMEIADTDSMDFREALKGEKEILGSLLARLQAI